MVCIPITIPLAVMNVTCLATAVLCLCYFCVTEFVELPGVGHCPQDEAPQIVNPLIEAWVLNSSSSSGSNGSSQQGGGAAAAVAAAAAAGGSTTQTSGS